MKRTGAAFILLLAVATVGLTGCGTPSAPPVSRQTVVYRPWTTAVLLASTDPTVVAASLESRRPEAIAYLHERGFLTSRDSLVTDAARADRLLRVIIRPDGGFDVTVFTQSSSGGTGSVLYETPGTVVIENAPVLPRTYRRYPRYADPFYRDPFYDPFWPTPEFFYHRRYGEPDPSYRRYPRSQPPPVVVQPAEPPPIRPAEPATPPVPREPPPPPSRPERRADERPGDEVRDQFPRPPK